jgi:vancomycin resistance protein VanJ
VTASEPGRTLERTDEEEARPDGTGNGRVQRLMSAASRPEIWKRGPVLAALAVLLGLVMLLHARIPNAIGNVGSLVETFLPWFGLFVPVLLAGALWRRSASAGVALLVPVLAWLHLFGGLLGDRTHAGGDLMLTSHNVGAANPDPAGTARRLAASGADVLALQEITYRDRGVYERELARTYPYHTAQGTVGLWSRLPLTDVRPVDTAMDAGPLGATKSESEKMTYNRALRATVTTAHGPLAVYVAHLGSIRVNSRAGFWTGSRNRNIDALGAALAAEKNPRTVLLGDLNGTVDDRSFTPLTAQLRSAQTTAGSGFGFTWPAAFPMVRIDQVLVRGVRPTSSWVLPATGSDHLPVAARIAW